MKGCATSELPPSTHTKETLFTTMVHGENLLADGKLNSRKTRIVLGLGVTLAPSAKGAWTRESRTSVSAGRKESP
ncbi:hypothetical protein N7539_005755 [Penicillium diatomitis]|uniref:Uncharacterized protein n=1 Tax=Penicillium diatomitis TaxID=2819901 RepID=A0A9W9X513_9EURO|nr:uncharacterized protein N7539_005755 [Penicillium diatomitis]KAJ5483959.1 hypothetical protein N7539_005755 [Penicillium diatomitis]